MSDPQQEQADAARQEHAAGAGDPEYDQMVADVQADLIGDQIADGERYPDGQWVT
ncbi:hypothetical protein GCM10009839_86360 [Catenulispora yoronensis]|uniref:Uncharacterized protein n=1 Tax=Catenulispora yoronensis TaxID=450799 RepID=A0ABN2VGW9_9ACTN